MSHPRRTREEWRAHLAAWKCSGLSGDDYARRHDLNANTFAWWRSQLGRERPSQPPPRKPLR
jgi:transposase-like protein